MEKQPTMLRELIELIATIAFLFALLSLVAAISANYAWTVSSDFQKWLARSAFSLIFTHRA
jgi:hypothetical protein